MKAQTKEKANEPKKKKTLTSKQWERLLTDNGKITWHYIKTP